MNVSFDEAWFVKSDLTATYLYRVSLKKARFTDCWVRDANLVECDLSDAVFENAMIDDVSLLGDFADASVSNTRFERVRIDPKSNLRGAAFRNVTFKDSKLREVDLTGAHLEGVGFSGDCEIKGLRMTAEQRRSVRFDLSAAQTAGIILADPPISGGSSGINVGMGVFGRALFGIASLSCLFSIAITAIFGQGSSAGTIFLGSFGFCFLFLLLVLARRITTSILTFR